MSKVLADGCFDPLHWGHIRYFMAAKALGTLVVHIATDDVIRAKGRQPFQTRAERADTIKALHMVDDVVLALSLCEAIQKTRPQFLVKGSEWAGCLPKDVIWECRNLGVEIFYTDTQERTSSDRLTRVLGPVQDVPIWAKYP